MTTEEMIRRYVEERQSVDQIAKSIGRLKAFVRRRLKKRGVQLRTIKEAVAISPFHNSHHPKYGADHYSWKGGRKIDMGYVRVMRPDHPEANPDGYVFEHRLVAEEKLGRRLAPSPFEEVHHINGNRADNRPENIAVMTKSAHMSLHMAERHRLGQIPYRRKA